jgi:tetratricopeptide (TPR) repeat protein
VTADPPSKLATDYADLAGAIGLPQATQTTDVNAQIEAVRRWLESEASGRWLLVLDNADEPDGLRGYLPSRGAGHVLLTSRRQRWGPSVRAIEVRQMQPRESVRLLLGRSGQSDAGAAGRLAEALGHLPLALAQDAGYLAESGMPLVQYLELFAQRRAELLRQGEPPDAYPWTVFATLDLAMSRINRPDAEDLLGLIACLAPDEIPRPLLEGTFDDPLGLAEALAALGRHSLVRIGAEVVEAHRLVQAVAWERMGPEVQARQAERAVRLLETAFPRDSNEVRTWEACKALQPHADQVARLAEQCKASLEAVGNLLDRVAIFDHYRARLAEAEARYRRALRIKEAAYGPDHPEVAITLYNLGGVLVQAGAPGQAAPMVERALHIFRRSLGDEHPHTAWARQRLQQIKEATQSNVPAGGSPGPEAATDPSAGGGPEPA